jgi:hypothetical protein
LSSLLDMNREEREQYVIQLWKAGRTVREIARLVHMSFGDIGAITKRLKLEADGERGPLEDDDNIKSKSKTTQAIKLFSELKSPVEVAIALDLSVDQVQAIYREYWKLEGMYGLTQIYEEAKYDLHDLLRLHRIVKDLGMEKQDVINVLEFVKHNQLRTLQWKAAYLRYQIDKLETEKTEAMNHLFKLKRMMHELEDTLGQKGKAMNQESGKDENAGNLYPVPCSPDTNSYSSTILRTRE